MFSLIRCLQAIRQILAFARVAGKPGPPAWPALQRGLHYRQSQLCVIIYCLHLQPFRDTIGKCWLSVSEWCLLDPSYQGNVAAPVTVIIEKLTVFQGACCSSAFSCSHTSIRWDAWFPEIHLKVLRDLAVLTEDVNGRDRNQSRYLADALELWIPGFAPSSHLAGRRACRDLDTSSLEKNNVSSCYCECHSYTGMFWKEKNPGEYLPSAMLLHLSLRPGQPRSGPALPLWRGGLIQVPSDQPRSQVGRSILAWLPSPFCIPPWQHCHFFSRSRQPLLTS